MVVEELEAGSIESEKDGSCIVDSLSKRSNPTKCETLKSGVRIWALWAAMPHSSPRYIEHGERSQAAGDAGEDFYYTGFKIFNPTHSHI